MNKKDLLILAAGEGTRFGHDIPKQFYKINGVPVFIRTLKRALKLPYFSKIILVINETFKEKYLNDMGEFGIDSDLIVMASGGVHRFDSIINGMKLVTTKDVILMEAARPFADKDIYNRVCSNENKTVISVMKSAQTPYIIEGSKLTSVISTDNVALSTTPKKYVSVDLVEKLKNIGADFNDEAELFINDGIHFEWCASTNIKITNPIDKFIAEKIACEEMGE